MMINMWLNKCNLQTNRFGKNKGYPKIAPPNMFPKTTFGMESTYTSTTTSTQWVSIKDC